MARPRGRPRKVPDSQTELEVEKEPEKIPEKNPEKMTEEKKGHASEKIEELTSDNAVERLKRLAGENVEYVQVEYRRVGNPPHGGFIDRLQFTTLDALDELPELLAKKHGGGVYRVQLLKMKVGRAMRYYSGFYEIAIAGPSKPIEPKYEDLSGMPIARLTPSIANPSTNVQPMEQTPQPMSMKDMLEFAQALQGFSSDKNTDLPSLIKAVSMLTARTQNPGQTLAMSPMAQMQEVIQTMTMLRQFDDGAKRQDEAHDEDDDQDFLSPKMLNKMISLAAIKMLSGSGLLGAKSNSSGAHEPRIANPSAQPPLPPPPDDSGRWAFLPGSGWIEMEDESELEDECAEDSDESNNLEGNGAKSNMSPQNISNYIKTLGPIERNRYISALATDIFNLDEDIVQAFLDSEANDNLDAKKEDCSVNG